MTSWADGTLTARAASLLERMLLPGVMADFPSGGDDTSMLLTKITAAVNAGGTDSYGNAMAARLDLHPGRYRISASLPQPSGLVINGNAKHGTVIEKTANFANMLDFAGASNASRCQRGGLRNVMLDGKGFTGTMIRCKWADHLNFANVFLYNNNGIGAYLENCWDSYFDQVEFDNVVGSDGFSPNVLISSNSDDSSNIIVFDRCRWEAFKDGAVWASTGPIVTANTMAVGANPVYGVFVLNSKMETPTAHGSHIDMSADVKTFHMTDMYVAARGVSSGGPYNVFGVNGADDMIFHRIRTYIAGASTVASLFSVVTNGGVSIRDALADCASNPTVALVNVPFGTPDMVIDNLRPGFGQTPTRFAGTWPPQIASAATVTLLENVALQVITGTTNITSITARNPGQRVTLKFNGALTVTDGSNLLLAGNFVTTADDTLTLVCDGTNWIEEGRSVN